MTAAAKWTRIGWRAAIGALLSALAACPVGATEQIDAAPLVEALLAQLAGAAGLRAEFLQINKWTVIDAADSARGTLVIAPPQRFLLEYREPAGHRVGCDGQFVWTYIPEERQVMRAAVTETTGWGDFFLRGLEESVDSLATLQEEGGRRCACFMLGARPQWGVRSLELKIDLATGDLVYCAYQDEEGNRIHFELRQVEFPIAFRDSLFHFTVPQGFELL
ncbi:MAG: outer membrane lipoprotein carrier protein LolA, partial [Candidatus Eisenbacteria sp.]|nr:outer membrane lipoprotein carrier protein LolA [Candidatus Eisenbacteria bacterium]